MLFSLAEFRGVFNCLLVDYHLLFVLTVIAVLSILFPKLRQLGINNL